MPSVQAIPVINLQKYLLLYEIACLIARTTGLFIGYKVGLDSLSVIALLSVIGAGLNVILIGAVLWRCVETGGDKKKSSSGFMTDP